MKRIEHNVETGEVLEIELTDFEIEQFEIMYANSIKESQIEKGEAEAKAAARQAILDRLGLTEEEARLLLGGN